MDVCTQCGLEIEHTHIWTYAMGGGKHHIDCDAPSRSLMRELPPLIHVPERKRERAINWQPIPDISWRFYGFDPPKKRAAATASKSRTASAPKEQQELF